LRPTRGAFGIRFHSVAAGPNSGLASGLVKPFGIG
jgi:hypothetical protein